MLPLALVIIAFFLHCPIVVGGYYSNIQPAVEIFSPLVQHKVLATSQNSSARLAGSFPWFTARNNGTWRWFPTDEWVSGFLPSTIFELNRRAAKCPLGDFDAGSWHALGNQWTSDLSPLLKHTTIGVDIGFISLPFQYQLALNPKDGTAIDTINEFATHYAARYNPIVGCTKSLDTTDAVGYTPDFEVIIDNMQTLQLLFASEQLTKNLTLRKIAISHADKTLENHIRPDGSTFHIVEYNSTTGTVIRKRQSFGYSDNSTWSRGQSWAIHGFSSMYYYTKYPRYLQVARQLAKYYLSNLPTNGVPLWDFNAPTLPVPLADTSSAAVAASALLLLSRLEASLTPANTTGEKYYATVAIKLLNDAVRLAWKPEWQSILANGTSNNRLNPPNNSTGLVFGDYFFVKAGNDLIDMGLASCHSFDT